MHKMHKINTTVVIILTSQNSKVVKKFICQQLKVNDNLAVQPLSQQNWPYAHSLLHTPISKSVFSCIIKRRMHIKSRDLFYDPLIKQ